MNYKIVGAALLALAAVATGAVAAAPGNAPVDAPIDDRAGQDGDAGVADEAGGDAGAATAAAADAAGERGPAGDLPGQVPDFVGEIHDLISQHLEESLDGLLGDEVSDVTPDDDGQPANAADA